MGNFGDIVEAGRDFACAIYKAQPGALIPNPISDLIKLGWDSLCGDKDPAKLPPPPAPPFTGGQCQCRGYRITHVITWNDGTSWTNTNDVWGAVTGIYCKPGDPNNRCQPIVKCRGFTFQGGCQLPGDYGVSSYSNGTTTGAPPRIRITSVATLDSQVDNCGNLPSSYPPSPPPPAGGYTSSPIVITYNDNTSFTVVYNFAPPTDGSKGVPEICMTATIQNVVQKICFPYDALPRLEKLLGGDPKLDELLEELRELKEDYDFDSNPPVYDNSPEVDFENLPPEKEGEGEASNLLGVRVTLTKFPQDIQYGTPTIYFAGWFAFKVQGGYEERHPIHFEYSYFPAPEGATGYAYTFTKGAEGAITVYSKKA